MPPTGWIAEATLSQNTGKISADQIHKDFEGEMTGFGFRKPIMKAIQESNQKIGTQIQDLRNHFTKEL